MESVRTRRRSITAWFHIFQRVIPSLGHRLVVVEMTLSVLNVKYGFCSSVIWLDDLVWFLSVTLIWMKKCVLSSSDQRHTETGNRWSRVARRQVNQLSSIGSIFSATTLACIFWRVFTGRRKDSVVHKIICYRPPSSYSIQLVSLPPVHNDGVQKTDK